MTIIIKTQAEWDALPSRFDDFTVIEIHSEPGVWLKIISVPEDSRAELWESSRAELWESSSAELRGRSTAHNRSTCSPVLHGQSVCFVYDKSSEPIRASEHATIIRVRQIEGVAGWLEEQGIEPRDSVTLYKRVSKDFLTQEGTPWQTTWLVGEVKLHPNWEPKTSECGAGKFHAVSRPYLGDQFRVTERRPLRCDRR